MSAAVVDRNPDYPDYGRPVYDSRPQNDYGRPSYDYNRPSYDSYQQSGDYNRSSYDPPRAQERYDQPSQYQRAPDPPVITSGIVSLSDEKAKERKHLIQMEMRKEYEDHIRRKDEQANRHREEIMHQRQASPPRQPQTEMYDHNQMSQTLREERRKEYNDYLKEVNGTPRAPPTPPVGLNIPTEAERHRIAELKKKQYREELLRQQKEQILNRAQHQLEIPVIDRRQAISDPPPPLDLSQDRPPSGRWDPDSYRQPNFGAVKRVTSPPHQANIGHDDYGSYRRQTEHDVRNREYNEFLAKKQTLEDERRQKLIEQRRQAPAPIVKGDYYSSEQYDHKRQALRDQQHREYQNYLKSKGFDKHQPPETNRRPELGMRSEFQDQKQEADRYRRLDNNRSENRIGFMSQLGRPVEEVRERLAKERHEDYNKYLQSKYNSQSQQRPLERPKWVDPKIMEDNWQKEAGGSRSNSRPPSNKPVQSPSYEEMLQRKRREEASYRRYDDPEYSRSGDPGRRPMP